jgi:sigma-E factor negative regulatory protein RseC
VKNPAGENTIEHKGIVHKNENESVSVLITSESACSGCHAENACTLAGSKEKIVEVKGVFGVKTGDPVIVTMKQASGYKALTLGYLIPLLIVLFTLIILIASGLSELISGLSAICILVPYYGVLYLLREKINEKFTFSIKA